MPDLTQAQLDAIYEERKTGGAVSWLRDLIAGKHSIGMTYWGGCFLAPLLYFPIFFGLRFIDYILLGLDISMPSLAFLSLGILLGSVAFGLLRTILRHRGRTFWGWLGLIHATLQTGIMLTISTLFWPEIAGITAWLGR